MFFTFTWMTPISLIILILLLVFKYASMYCENKASDLKVKLKCYLFSAFIDTKRLILWIMFFVSRQWYLIWLAPLLVQILFIVVISIKSMKSKLDKVMMILNEALVAVFWALSITTLTYSPLLVNIEALRTSIALILQWTMTPILIAELGMLSHQTFRDIYL